MFARTGWVFSTQTHILILVVIIVAPVLTFVGVLLANVASNERLQIESRMREQVRVLASLIDRELAGLEYTLFSLANAPVLHDTNGLESFHEYAQEVARARDATIALRDSQSNVVVNSAIPAGEPVPRESSLGPTDQRAGERRSMVVSNLFTGLVVERPTIAVVMPILRDGEVRYFLSLSISADQIAEALAQVSLPEHEVGIIIDGDDHIIARSADQSEFVGTRASIPISNTREREGRSIGENREGERIHTFYARSELSDWIAAISTPEAQLSAPMVRSMQTLLLLGVVFIGLSLISALWLARRFATPIRALAKGATALGENHFPPPLETSVREIRNVWENLRRAAHDLQARTQERDTADAALRALNSTLEAQVEARTAQLTESNMRLLAEMGRREKTESRLRQTQKLEAVGQLTGGIAHDFNNMLAAILGGLQLIKRRLTNVDPDIQSLMDSVIESTNRAAQLTRRLLAFARKQPLSPAPTDVNKLIQGMSELLRRTLPELVSMETVLAAGLWRVHVDANQLENAILNLAINARDAMPQGGRLTIETSNAYLDDAYAENHEEVTAGQYVLIAVTDTGEGMNAEVISCAFDPFFTTKEKDQGTGLGLSQVYGFIKQSGGHVKIYSELGAGTSVKLYLPRFTEANEVAQEEIASYKVRDTATGELVLVVEDDDRVRAVTLGLLHELGYLTLEADNGVTALRLLDANPQIHMLLTDVVMPKMNGRQLADEVLQRRPDLRVLFITGYTRNAIVHNGTLDSGVHMLVKPFTLEELALKMRIVLDS